MQPKELWKPRKRWQQAIERAELKAAEIKKRIHESGVPIAKDRKINIQRANFEQHSEGLETASVALELDDVYELDEMFF